MPEVDSLRQASTTTYLLELGAPGVLSHYSHRALGQIPLAGRLYQLAVAENLLFGAAVQGTRFVGPGELETPSALGRPWSYPKVECYLVGTVQSVAGATRQSEGFVPVGY